MVIFRCGSLPVDKSQHKCVQTGGRIVSKKVADLRKLETRHFRLANQAHLGALTYFTYKPQPVFTKIADLFNFLSDELKVILSNLLGHYSAVKLRFVLGIILVRMRFDEVLEEKQDTIWCPYTPLTHQNFIDLILFQIQFYLIEVLNVRNKNGSDWILKEVTEVQLQVGQYQLKLSM